MSSNSRPSTKKWRLRPDKDVFGKPVWLLFDPDGVLKGFYWLDYPMALVCADVARMVAPGYRRWGHT